MPGPASRIGNRISQLIADFITPYALPDDVMAYAYGEFDAFNVAVDEAQQRGVVVNEVEWQQRLDEVERQLRAAALEAARAGQVPDLGQRQGGDVPVYGRIPDTVWWPMIPLFLTAIAIVAIDNYRS